MVSTLGSFGIVGVGLIGSEFVWPSVRLSLFVKSDRSLFNYYFRIIIITLKVIRYLVILRKYYMRACVVGGCVLLIIISSYSTCT